MNSCLKITFRGTVKFRFEIHCYFYTWDWKTCNFNVSKRIFLTWTFHDYGGVKPDFKHSIPVDWFAGQQIPWKLQNTYNKCVLLKLRLKNLNKSPICLTTSWYMFINRNSCLNKLQFMLTEWQFSMFNILMRHQCQNCPFGKGCFPLYEYFDQWSCLFFCLSIQKWYI